MTKVIKKSLIVVSALIMTTCLLAGLCFKFNGVKASATTATITFDGDYTTTDTPAYEAVGGITAMGGGIDASHVPGAWHGIDWSELTHPEGVDGKCIGVAINPWNFTGIRPIMFKTPIKVTEGMNSMTFRIYADLSTSDTYGLTSTKNIGHNSAGIWFYGLGETGLAGEGVMVPFNIEQGKWVDLVISGEDFEKFVDTDGKVKGFKMASGIVNGSDTTILKSGGTAAIYIDTITFGTAETNELKDADFTDGKATLFTGNGDYDYAYGDRNRYDYPAVVNGATSANYSDWGACQNYPDYTNINGLTLATEGAYYSFADMKAGSKDGYAIATEITSWGLSRCRSITFDKKVKASEIGSLSFRLFANLDSTNDDTNGYCGYDPRYGIFANDPGTPDGTPYNGIFFFSPDSACGYNQGVRLNPFVKQREWTEVTLAGDELLKLADKDGYISGIRLGSALISGSDAQLYGGGATGVFDKAACVIIDEITVNKATAVDNSVTLFNGNDGIVNKTAKIVVEGNNIADLNTAWAGNGFSAVSENFVDLYDLTASGEGALFDLDAVKQGSNNGHALGVAFHYWGYTTSPTVYFDKTVKATDVKSLVFRIYANISPATTYGGYDASTGKFLNSASMQDTTGIFIYTADKNAKGEGYLVKGNVKQREWIELTLCKEDLLKLADKNGMISGFRIGAGLVINGESYMYGKGDAYDKGNVIFVDSVTALKEHPASDWIIDQNATCEEAGSKHKECTNCGEDLETAVITANGHTYGDWIDEVPATCTANGTKGHYHCSVCNKDFDAEYKELSDLTITAKGHTYGDWIDEVSATCTVNGTKGHYHCSVCNKDFDAEDKELTDLTITAGHTYGEWIAEVPAEIGVAGTKGHHHCSVCNKNFDAEYKEIESLVIPALNGIKYASLSLNGDIGVNFYAYVGGVDTLTANNGELTSVKQTVDNVEYFKFTINVAAKDYKEDVAIAIDGKDISVTYKVETYIDAITDTNPAYALVQSLKNYCESARAFFAGETPVAMDSVEIAKENASSVEGDDANIDLVGATLILESKTAIKVYFKAESLAEKTFTVGGTTVVPVAVEGYNGLYMITVDNISAVDLDTKYVIVVGGYTVNFSAISYAYSVLSDAESSVALANVVKTLYNYNALADAYATSQGE